MKRSLFVFVVLLVLVSGLVVWMKRPRTPPIRDEAGRSAPGSITSLETISLGGVEQAVLIRGWDATNPLLLFLHGGPGMPMMYLAHTFQRDLEKEFRAGC